MSLPSSPVAFLAVQQAIYNHLVAELNPDGGRLVGVKSVGSTWLNEVDTFPYVHLSFAGLTQEQYAVWTSKQTFSFVVGLAVKSTLSLTEAQNSMYTLLDDGNGNGLIPILNDPTFFSINQLAQYGFVKELQTFDNYTADKASAPNMFISYAAMKYDVTDFSRWNQSPQ